jgi:hypothetical protein
VTSSLISHQDNRHEVRLYAERASTWIRPCWCSRSSSTSAIPTQARRKDPAEPRGKTFTGTALTGKL